MPQFSSSKKTLTATGPKALHDRKYNFRDHRPQNITLEYNGQTIKAVKDTNIVLVALPNWANGTGRIDAYRVDRNGVLYNRVPLVEGTPSGNTKGVGHGLDVYSSNGTFTVVWGNRDNSTLMGSVIVRNYNPNNYENLNQAGNIGFAQYEYSRTIANPDQSGTSSYFGGDDAFGRGNIYDKVMDLLDHNWLMVAVPDYNVSANITGRVYIFEKNISNNWSLDQTINNIDTTTGDFGRSVEGYVDADDNRRVYAIADISVDDGGTNAGKVSFFRSDLIFNQGLYYTNYPSSVGANYGKAIIVSEKYRVISSSAPIYGDVGKIWIAEEATSGITGNFTNTVQFYVNDLPEVPFGGQGAGGSIYFGQNSGNMDIDNDILYVTNWQGDNNFSSKFLGTQKGGLAKYDLITGRLIDIDTIPNRGRSDEAGLSISVNNGRAFISERNSYVNSSFRGIGAGIDVIDDLYKTYNSSTGYDWKSAPQVIAIEQKSTKALTTTDSSMEAVDHEGYRAIEFFNNDRDVALQELTFPLDMPTTGWFTLEFISKIDRTSSNQVVLQLKHETDSSLDVFCVIGTTNQPTRLQVGSITGSTGSLGTFAHSDTRYKHLGFGWETSQQTTQNWIGFQEQGGIQSEDNGEILDVPSKYNQLIIGTTDTGTGTDLNAGWIAQIKISSVQQYGPGDPFFNYTDPVLDSNNSRLEYDSNTIFMWEAPTTY